MICVFMYSCGIMYDTYMLYWCIVHDVRMCYIIYIHRISSYMIHDMYTQVHGTCEMMFGSRASLLHRCIQAHSLYHIYMYNYLVKEESTFGRDFVEVVSHDAVWHPRALVARLIFLALTRSPAPVALRHRWRRVSPPFLHHHSSCSEIGSKSLSF